MRYLLLPAVLLFASLAWAQDTGPVNLGGVTYDHVDPGAPFTEGARPVQDWQPPSPTVNEAAAGGLTYQASDPGEYRTYRVPRPEEHVSRLSTFLAPGQDEAVCFGLYALADLEGLALKVEGKGGLTVDARYEHCWPQRTGWRSRQWYLTPELLLPCADGKKTVPLQRGVLGEAPFNLAATQTVGFWLTVTAPAEARPGVYHLTVSLTSARRPRLDLPLDVQVLPFKLQQPADRSWLLYADHGRWNKMSDAQVLAELKDFARHGMTGLIEIPLGQPDLAALKDTGKVSFDAGVYRRYATLCAQAGMPGPHVIGSAGAGAVRDVVAPGTNLEKGDWPAAVKSGVQALAQAAVEATRDLPPWYYYGVDEPSGTNTFAIQDNQAWHDGGAHTYATFYDPAFLSKAAAYLDAPCFVVGLISNEQSAKRAREACRDTGAEFWWYGTGSYVNPFPQEGYMWHNRYGAGLLFWKSGARAEATWTFCRPHEDVFNDFDGSRANSGEPKEQVTAYPHFLKPDDWSTYQGALPTLAWEGLREGVDDYRYLYTLTQLIAQARKSQQAAVLQAADDAERDLQALVAAVPFANPMGPVGFETVKLQLVRRAVADRIIVLGNALQGQASRPRHTVQQFNLRVVAQAGAEPRPLPALTVGSAVLAPTIDGKLDEQCWETAGVADNFVAINDGAPAHVPTTARITADDRALYLAFDCTEPALDKMRASETAHDGQVWLEDSVEFFLASAGRRPYAHIIVTTAGVVLDEVNQDAEAWNPHVRVATGKNATGWTVELALPWDDLKPLGIERASVLTANFGRSRYTSDEAQPHTGWSATYGGFHEPGRFGWLFVPNGSLVLESLQLPSAWGAQELKLGVRNLTAQPATALFALRGAGNQTLTLPGNQSGSVSFPTNLRRGGTRALNLSWGAAGATPETLALLADIPEAVTVPAEGGLVKPYSTVELPVTLNLARAEQEHLRLRVRVSDGLNRRFYELPATPEAARLIQVRAPGAVKIQLTLVDEFGNAAWEGPEMRYLALGE